MMVSRKKERAVLAVRHDPPTGVLSDWAVAMVEDVLCSIGLIGDKLGVVYSGSSTSTTLQRVDAGKRVILLPPSHPASRNGSVGTLIVHVNKIVLCRGEISDRAA
jgi:hypothetical protein